MLSLTSNQQLDIGRLQSKKREKESRRYQCYEDVLLKCHKRITKAAEAEAEATVFQVPSFQFGMPPTYNVKACMCYLIYNLRRNGFFVKYLSHDMLYMAWCDLRPKNNALPANIDTHAFAGQQPIAAPKEETRKSIEREPDTDTKLALINKSLFRPINDPKPVYDTDAMESLTRFAQRIRNKKTPR